tara:strand:- start:47 stop:544 length:498 start_codon:yes stop_codon:yes gene_type:complete
MVCYISFSIDGRDLMINEDNPDDIKIWKNNKYSKSRWNQIKIITRPDGYKVITITPKLYRLHRINYFAHNQDWNIHDSSPSNQIDHEDIDCTNNNIENLRVVTHQENRFNTKAKGYYWRKKEQKWHARIMVDGKYKHLGYFVLEEDARNAYLTAKEIYHVIPNRK